jgi:hypothetical protein
MASNFQILSHESRDSLYLKLTGDFDGTSAFELLETLKKYGRNFYQIFIDTHDLKTIHPFGRQVFQKKLGAFNQKFNNLTFIGKNGQNIALN